MCNTPTENFVRRRLRGTILVGIHNYTAEYGKGRDKK